jgi:flagellar biosynthetic protein FliR
MTITFGTLFLAFDGHHEVIRTLRASFDAVPPGGGRFNAEVILQLIPQTVAMFGIGIRLAVVVMLPLFLVSIGLALVSRAFPQANIFSLGYSITLLLGLVLLATAGPGLQAAVIQGIHSGVHDGLKWTQGFIPR